jgi:hypothetical protein
MEAVGGAGTAWIEFDVSTFGANQIAGEFAIPSLGIIDPVFTYVQHNYYVILVKFGQAISYSLFVENQIFPGWEPDVLTAGLVMSGLEV